MRKRYRMRRLAGVLSMLAVLVAAIVYKGELSSTDAPPGMADTNSGHVLGNSTSGPAVDALTRLEVKGRAPKTDYSRDQFGDGWADINGCDTRNTILARDLKDIQVDEKCNVLVGRLDDPYTGKQVQFIRGPETSDDVQIDHIVSLSNAWQTGAAQWGHAMRVQFSNDPLELLAVDGEANQQKSDSDAATWLPPNKAFRCQLIARQIAVKTKYQLWVTQPEKAAMERVLFSCPGQPLPSP